MSKLREHWDETNSVVLARKTQLDAMYADTHKFDAKRAELETWLARMEARLERMAPVAHTADVLDQQIREQKVNLHNGVLSVRLSEGSDGELMLAVLFSIIFIGLFMIMNMPASTPETSWHINILSKDRFMY